MASTPQLLLHQPVDTFLSGSFAGLNAGQQNAASASKAHQTMLTFSSGCHSTHVRASIP